jgi:hypothetical protein
MVGLLNVLNNLKKFIHVRINIKLNHMNKLLVAFLFLTGFARTQIVIEFDNMETSSAAYLSAGWWTLAPTAGWFTNASISPTISAAIHGQGSGTSGIEQDWYSLPNVTGLNSTRQYQLKFRLASYTFSAPSAATRGVDAADYVSVQVSTNGGVSYVTELRITGNSNAQWAYSATGVINHTANGVFTNSAFPTGDVYQAPAGISTTAPTFITLDLPTSITQVAVDIYCRVNSAGEEWWIDNIELVEETALPVELTYFEGMSTGSGNVLIWKTASEHNSDYFLIERSTTGEFTENSVVGSRTSAGFSNQLVSYSFIDNDFSHSINYYQLVQVDRDGQFKTYGPIAIDNTRSKILVKTINLLGQECDPLTVNGTYIEIYDDGSMKKVIR